MLKITPDPQFEADIEITVPGQKETGTISLTLKYRNPEQLKAFWDEHEDKDLFTAFKGIVLGWKDVDAKFTDENIKIFLKNYPRAAVEIMFAYKDLLIESRVKN